MVTAKTLALLPDVEFLCRLTQALAMLEAILCPRLDLRYYAFNSKWGDRQMMASMNNGGSDESFILFNPAGAIIKGFDHESEMSPYASEEMTLWLGLLDHIPREFQEFLSEPAFKVEDTTFYCWRRYIDRYWQTGHINYPGGDEEADGSGWMLSSLDGNPVTYQQWAEDYHGRKVNLELVRSIYQHQPLTEEIVQGLNGQLWLSDLARDVEEIGYPLDAI
jgi:hypothetical protein